MLRLSRLVSDRSLGLEVLVDVADPEVGWAHVSELRDPTPWLTGGELLLTTGLELFRSSSETREFCRRLVAAEVAALGVSVGASLPHRTFPDILVEESRAAGLPLVRVPEMTPLQAVVRAVSTSLNEEETLPLRRALVAQRQLGRAATRENGVEAILRILHEVSGFRALVTDPGLHPVASQGQAARDLLERYRPQIKAQIPHGLRWSFSDDVGALEKVQISPLGTQGKLRGILIASKTGLVTDYDRALLSMVVSQLSVLAELRHSARRREREQRARAATALLTQSLAEVDAVIILARAGVECREIRVARFSSRLDEVEMLILDSALESSCSDVLYRSEPEATWAILCEPGETVAAELRDALLSFPAECPPVAGNGKEDRPRPAAESNNSRGDRTRATIRVGVGAGATPGEILRSARQAERALNVACDTGRRMVELSRVDGFRALLALGSEIDRAEFCEGVLQQVDEHPNGQQLLDALRAYLRAVGNMEDAATALGVHRHTVRTRLEQVENLTARRLSNAEERLELWLAVEMRDLAT